MDVKMCRSTLLLFLLGASSCCLALPRRGSTDDLPQPVLPQALIEDVESNDAVEVRSDPKAPPYTIVDVASAIPSFTVIDAASASIYNGLKILQKLYYKDNSILHKMIEHLESFQIIKTIRDRCNNETTKHEVSCSEVYVPGFKDFFGDAWYKISTYFKERHTRISDRITEKKDKKDGISGSEVVTDPDTKFSSFVKWLNLRGLDGLGGKPVVTYDREADEAEDKKDEHKEVLSFNGKTPQEQKDEALQASHIKTIKKHNFFAKAVNAGIKLAGVGVFAALCAQNCGIDNLLGIGTPLPPLDDDVQAANDAAIAADAAGDTDGDNDVDGDDGRRKDTLVADSYQGYDHNGDYLGYNTIQPQSQPSWNNYFTGGNDPGYAPGTFPGWYPPQINNDNDSYSKHNNNNHLLQPSEHPDFSSRLGQARESLSKAIHSDTNNGNLRSIVQGTRQSDPQPVFRGARMLQQP